MLLSPKQQNFEYILCQWLQFLTKFDYEMVHSEVYLNKYVVSIAPFSTPACPDCSQNIT